MNKGLDYYINTLTHIFKKNQPRIAHTLSKDLLLEMAKDKTILLEIIDRNIKKNGFFLQERINPVIAITAVDNPFITLIAHFWMPLPDRVTNITHQSIHHHGRLLLTSAASYGPGYESIIFKQGFTIDPQTGFTTIEIDKEYKNPLYNIEYIEANTPHVVFYPKELSVTYALWTYDKRSIADRIRRNSFLQKNKAILLRFFNYVKGLNIQTDVFEYFDFFPSNSKMIAMKDRILYPVGSNENHIHNVFYILQQVGYTDYEGLKKILTGYPDKIKQQGLNLISKIESEEQLADIFDPAHLNIEKINFSREEIKRVVSGQ
ncbi:hypothetical protein [Cytophaga aurantiaca]|uniref:hypothetical protein n=1 Tax=Cytophaga aurantiaca TaxID=29530 RepID=UPI00037D61B2|nr:hypothetical protein [Cytophaga aurantiaca]